LSSGKQGVVLDGRDIGLVVLPEATCKIYVTASSRVRAERRLKELHQKGIDSIYEAVLEDIKRVMHVMGKKSFSFTACGGCFYPGYLRAWNRRCY